MPVNSTQALAAYANTAARKAAPGLEPRATDGGGNFGEALQATLDSTTRALGHSEAMSTQALAGNAELSQVVTAVANAELTLQTVIAVRDKVIQAYQDILRMPI